MPGATAANAAVDTAFVEVHVTTPDAGTAARLAHHLLLVKTTRAAFPAIRARVGSEHPYDIPEVLALAVVDVAPGYAAWLSASFDPGPTPGPPQTPEGTP